MGADGAPLLPHEPQGMFYLASSIPLWAGGDGATCVGNGWRVCDGLLQWSCRSCWFCGKLEELYVCYLYICLLVILAWFLAVSRTYARTTDLPRRSETCYLLRERRSLVVCVNTIDGAQQHGGGLKVCGAVCLFQNGVPL